MFRKSKSFPKAIVSLRSFFFGVVKKWYLSKRDLFFLKDVFFWHGFLFGDFFFLRWSSKKKVSSQKEVLWNEKDFKRTCLQKKVTEKGTIFEEVFSKGIMMEIVWFKIDVFEHYFQRCLSKRCLEKGVFFEDVFFQTCVSKNMYIKKKDMRLKYFCFFLMSSKKDVSALDGTFFWSFFFLNKTVFFQGVLKKKKDLFSKTLCEKKMSFLKDRVLKASFFFQGRLEKKVLMNPFERKYCLTEKSLKTCVFWTKMSFWKEITFKRCPFGFLFFWENNFVRGLEKKAC